MFFTIGFFMALIGFIAWRLDLKNPNITQIKINNLKQVIISPTTFGVVSFFIGIIGTLLMLGSLASLVWAFLP